MENGNYLQQIGDLQGNPPNPNLIELDAPIKSKADNYRQAAKANYQKALDILVQLDANNSLAEAERKFLNKMKAAVEKYQK